MSVIALKERVAPLVAMVEERLATCFSGRSMPQELAQAMQYSLLAGGKRIRPVLCLLFAQAGGIDPKEAVSFACGIECIHTYSLVHDDLPAMDDDDLRRGRPSNHKMFGEALAILAGDSLLTDGIGLMLETDLPADRVLDATRLLVRAAGGEGMVGGQVLDMAFTGSGDLTLDALRRMHAMKTGALIIASCESGAVLAGSRELAATAREYAALVGLAFQVVDDILDVIGDQNLLGKPVGSDEAKAKATYPALIGLEQSQSLARKLTEKAAAALRGVPEPSAETLRELAAYIARRIN